MADAGNPEDLKRLGDTLKAGGDNLRRIQAKIQHLNEEVVRNRPGILRSKTRSKKTGG